jgi:pSer/pThr/pTyr-binding forkhead associated (FHA) protein
MGIRITVVEPGAGAPVEKEFIASPIRLGRNELNDIALTDPFVSEWHGVLRFDDQAVYYFDLGSLNGSTLANKRLVKNTPTVLTPEDVLFLGRVRLTFQRTTRTVPPPSRAPTQNPMAMTVAWGVKTDDARRSGVRPSPTIEGGPVRATGSGRVSAVMEASPGSQTQIDGRLLRVMQAFADAFVGLRKGFEVFGDEVGVRTVNGTSPLHRARTGNEVMQYLMDASGHPEERLRELQGIFADFGIHHVAVLEGILEGARAMLTTIDPHAYDLDAKPGIFGGRKPRWKEFDENFTALLKEDSALTSKIFGKDFAHAYARVARGEMNEEDSSRGDEDLSVDGDGDER